MNVPDCIWKQRMEEELDTRAILSNLQREECINESTVDKFFRELLSRGNPGFSKEAKEWAVIVVASDSKTFTCIGEEVPADSFKRILRLEDVPSIRYHLPDDFLRNVGLPDRSFRADAAISIAKRVSTVQLKRIIGFYTGSWKFGNYIGIVWGTDYETSQSHLTNILGLIERLGIKELLSESRCIVYTYERVAIGRSLNVPRAFDGINNPLFDLQEDCAAPYGRTKPLPPHGAMESLPEAVHQSCELVPEWDVREVA